MKYIFLFFFSLSTIFLFANDGAFYARGNQLIPINETDISVKKEILTLKKVYNNFVEVTVYYEFFNPKEAKQITVGFEAFSPSGDVEGAPRNGQHPYMRDFTVELNNSILQYSVAIVSDTLYNVKGKIKTADLKTMGGNTSGNDVDFFYVYHFKANFKKGLNIIKHTYIYDVSGSVDYNYDIDYVLTAAKRWANKQIDDFTLVLDMGPFETFFVSKSFFKTSKDWLINGIGKTTEIKGNKNSFFEADAVKFYIQKGNIIFQKYNFKPQGELQIYAQNFYGCEDLECVPFSIYQVDKISEPKTDLQRKILKNLPYARRGYVFTNLDLKKYFENMDWYIPNPNYEPDNKYLTTEEQNWLEKWL